MWARYPPAPPIRGEDGEWKIEDGMFCQRHLLFSIFHLRPFQNCGENEIQASLISSASVGATPTPATNVKGSDPAAGL